jgi:hypothetical protein
MTKVKIYCVVTTIHDFSFLLDFANSMANDANAQLDVTFLVIIDKKTPSSLESNIKQARSLGLQIGCPSLKAQENFLKKLGLSELVPYNSDNRRNVGFLMAYAAPCDVLISLDDDNRPVAESPFFSEHLTALTTPAPKSRVTSPNLWFNICNLLEVKPNTSIFPRGFPYSKRLASHEEVSVREPEGKVGANVGMWIGDPDVDAATRLSIRPRALSIKRLSVYLSAGTWTPINTQNTSLQSELVPAYYYLRMGDMGNGKKLDRFGDVWSGYFLQAVMKHLNYVTRVGTPVVEHVRTFHDLIQDLSYELPGIQLTEALADWLPTVKLSGSTPAETYESLTEALDEQADHFTGWAWDEPSRKYMHNLANCMRLWLRGIRQIAG